MIRYFLLSAVFQASVVLGMQSCQCGVECSSERKDAMTSEVVKDAFEQKDISDVNRFLDNAFQAFNRVAQISSQHVNLLFHHSNLYINRFFPLNFTYEGVKIQNGVQYTSLQVSDILGFDKEQIAALQQISYNISYVKNVLNCSCMCQMWKELVSLASNENRIYCVKKSNYKYHYLKLCEFINAATTLGYDISNKLFTKETVNEIYFYAQKYCLEYANKIADYVSFFGENDSNKLKQDLNVYQNSNEQTLLEQQKPDILLNMQKICCRFAQYAHTEYMLKYRLFKNPNVNISSVSFVSYYDMCDNCENLWAGIAKVDLPVKVVSCQPYYSSRSKDRGKGNPNLMLAYSSK